MDPLSANLVVDSIGAALCRESPAKLLQGPSAHAKHLTSGRRGRDEATCMSVLSWSCYY